MKFKHTIYMMHTYHNSKILHRYVQQISENMYEITKILFIKIHLYLFHIKKNTYKY